MYNHFDSESSVKAFLYFNCLHLTKELSGDTGVPKGYFDITNWTVDKKLQLTTTFNSSLTTTLQGKTGVYTIYSMSSGEFAIGSTTDFDARFQNHYSDSINPKLANRLLYNEVNKVGGWNNFLWEPSVFTPNYYLDFIKDNLNYASDYQVFRVLQTYTQYEARIYEQALQAFCKPKLNGAGDVVFNNTWDPKDVRPSKLGKRLFIAITESGRSIEFLSINAATDILGISRKTIATVLNYPNIYVECPKLSEKCRFVEPHLPIKSGNPYISPYMRPTLNGIDYNQLPLDRVFAFTESFELHSDYANSSEAAFQCGFGDKYYRISRNINTRFVICLIDGISIKLLFAQNPLSKGSQKPVLCLDTTTNTSTSYKSVNDCARAIGPVDSSGLIKNYIRPGKLYQGKFLITYISKF